MFLQEDVIDLSRSGDDFKQSVRSELARRVGYLCSNPGCRILTVGPTLDGDKGSVGIGEAAHIKAASPNGPRYDPNMTSEERSGIANGIWLCRNCHRVVDRDVDGHPAEVLYEWKYKAEQEARYQIQCIGHSSDLFHLSTVSLGLLGDCLSEAIEIQKRILTTQRAIRMQLISVKAAPGPIARIQAEYGFIVIGENLRDAVEDYILSIGDLSLYVESVGVDPLTSSRFIDYHNGIRSIIRKDRKLSLSFLDLSRRLVDNMPTQPLAAEAVASMLTTIKDYNEPHRKIMELGKPFRLIASDDEPEL